MDSILILHFSPLELYPPIQNLLGQLDKSSQNVNVRVITTRASGVDLPPFTLHSNRIKIVRYGKSGRIPNLVARYLNYLKFHLGAIFDLFTYKPSRVLYFETLSSLPVVIYKALLRTSAKVYIHYHEYTSPKEYQAVKFMGFLHRFEKKIVPTAAWVSHTNSYRLKLFEKDLLPLRICNAFIMPNYPPRSWYSPVRPEIEHPLRIVYAGALSLSSMHTKEFAEWIIQQNGRVFWDIYSYNINEDAKQYFLELNSSYIKLIPGVGYNELPMILKNYQIGVILYKGVIPNHIYSVSNKLYEYLTCGLAVWFPAEITGSHEYVTENTYPEVVKLDFLELNDYNVDTIIDRSTRKLKEFDFFCETSLAPLIASLFKRSANKF
jgi:hypothetical protein